MQKTMIAALFAAGVAAMVSAGVQRVGADGPIMVDGRLDEPVWAKVKWEGDFKPFVANAGSAISQQTSFAILTDMTNLYVGVKCDEAEMEKLRKLKPPSLWNSDFVQLDLSPTCDPFDYYQFAVMYHNEWRNSQFYSEGGNIRPDPCFSPEWETAVADREGGWDVEIKIPLSSFYMTRNSAWKKGEWMLNVGRKRVVGRQERSNWSQLTESFREPKNMGRMDGFPSRRRNDDVMMSEAKFFPEGVKDGKIIGELVADAFLGSTGDYEFSASSGTAAKKRRLLHDQTVKLRVPAVYPENGRYDTELVLRRGNGETYRRHSKVKVDFTPIMVKLELPEYRGNFYPGQDSSVVKGSVLTVSGGELTISLEGPGIDRAEVKTKDGHFEFATPAFSEGAAELTVRGADGEVRLPIRKLAKTGRQMSWIANGQLVVDGRPTVSRRLAHPGYRGGEKMDRFISTADFGETREVREQSIEFGRLVPGSETSEGMQDRRPSDAVLAAIDRRIEELRDKDFVFYYLCDEPECRSISSVYLKHLYDHIAERDPYHVLRIGTRAPLEYLNCCDWFETHPYINPQNLPDGRRVYGRAINEIGDFVSAISDLHRKDKCIGFYQTAFAYKYSNPYSDYPTFQEYVCHSWAGIIRGARTIIPYAYHDFGDRPSLFEGTRFMFKTIEVLEPFIVADNRTVLERTKERECVRYECKGDTLTVAVDFKTMDVKVEVTGEYAAKLPNYAETQAKVDKAEYARTHRGNLLARDWRKLKLTSSLGKCKPWNGYKLVDGTLDMLAWKPDASKAKVKDRYLEMTLTDGAITFSRLEFAGWHLENMKVKVRKGEGEWVEPAEKTSHGEEFAAGVEFAEPVEADGIRLEFASAKVELYEIEAFAGAAEPPYQFRSRLETVHERGLRDASLRPAADEFEFRNGVKVGDGDFADYLNVSMGVRASAETSSALRMEIDPSLREREYEIEVGKRGVTIRAKDERARHQALYHLEDLMNLRRAPFLRFGKERRRMRFSPRMLHSGWGVDVFPDAHLKQMAHHGFDAILVFLKGEDKTQGEGGCAGVNGLIERASRLGIDTYLYSKVSSFAHPADPDGAEKLRNSFGKVAKAHPKAKGIVFVGESCQFPSKDPRVQPVDYRQKNHDDPRPLAGWFPCRDYPEWLRAVKVALAEHAPDMEIVFWTYNWTRQPKEPCAEVIAAFPDGTAVQATYEKTGTAVHRNGISNVCRDYTISSVGPTDHFEAEAKAAASTHRRFYAMTNTGGLTWDYGVVPYQPCPFQWKKRWDGLVESARTCGLSGLMESHHYGWYPSFVTELAKEAFTEGGRDFDSHIRAIAVRDFGERNADAVLGIWKSWSTAMEDYVASNENQYGPFRIGPAFPYSIGRRHIDWSEFPQEKGATHTMRWMAYLNFPYDRKQAQQLNIEFFGVEEDFRVKQLELFELMRAAYAEGAAKLKEIAAELDPVRREKALRMAYLGEWHQRTVETAINLNRGYLAHLHGDEEGLLKYARLEYANTEAALKLAEADSRLGFEPSMLYAAGPVQLRWKLALMREMYPQL